MAENAVLKIVGTLDVPATKPIVDAKIEELEGKIKKLNLQIKLDDNVMKTLKDFSEQMSKIADIALNTGKIIEKSLNPDGSSYTRTYYSGLKGEFSDIVTEAKKAGDAQLKALSDVSDGFTKTRTEAQKYNSELQKIAETIKLTNDTGTQTRNVKMNGEGGVLSYTDTTNYSKAEKDAQDYINWWEKSLTTLETEQNKVTQSLNKMYDAGLLNEKFFENFNKVINSTKNVEEIDKVSAALQRVSQFSKNQNMQQSLISQAQSLLNSGKNFDENGILSLITDLKNLNLAEENATREISLMQSALKNFQASATSAAEKTMTFGEAIKSSLSNLSMYIGGTALFFQSFNFLKDGVSYLTDLNHSLTTISMILHESQDQVQQLGNQYQQLGNQLSVSTTEIAKSATELIRQGLSMDEVNSRLQQITMFSKVAGLSAEDATNMITAATNSMKISAQQATDTFAALGHSSGVNAG